MPEESSPQRKDDSAGDYQGRSRQRGTHAGQGQSVRVMGVKKSRPAELLKGRPDDPRIQASTPGGRSHADTRSAEPPGQLAVARGYDDLIDSQSLELTSQ